MIHPVRQAGISQVSYIGKADWDIARRVGHVGLSAIAKIAKLLSYSALWFGVPACLILAYDTFAWSNYLSNSTYGFQNTEPPFWTRMTCNLVPGPILLQRTCINSKHPCICMGYQRFQKDGIAGAVSDQGMILTILTLALPLVSYGCEQISNSGKH